MRIREDFILHRIGEEMFLLPTGNAIASFLHGVSLSGVGEELAERMMEETTEEELLSYLIDEYGDEVSREDLKADLDEFLSNLRQSDVLETEIKRDYCYSEEIERTYRIADLIISYTGPRTLLFENLTKFECREEKNCDQEVNIYSYRMHAYKTGRIIVRGDELVIYETESEFGLLYPENKYLREMVVKKDGSVANLYMLSADEQGAEEVFFGMRSAFIILAQTRGFFAFHSVSAEYRGGAVLFSGMSGAGKSTHSNIWEKVFGVDILNGDLNLLGKRGDEAYVYGIPWCGTSGIYGPFAKKFLGVFFINQAKDNEVKEIEGAKRVLALSNRMISPTWTKDTYKRNLEYAEDVERGVFLGELFCNMEDEAATCAKEALDNYLDNK